MTTDIAYPALVPVRPIGTDAFPAELQTRARTYWLDYLKAAEGAGLTVPDGEFGSALRHAAVLSPFIAVTCLHHPALPVDLWASGDLLRAYADDGYRERLSAALAGIESQAQLIHGLRRFRRREMVRLAWRDLAGWASLGETLEELSGMADAVLEAALAALEGWQRRDLGTPLGRNGLPQSLVVIAMGKLGARELNFSSDVDLIFAFPEAGEVQRAAGPLSNQEFFVRLGQRLIHVLSAPTSEGIVFRVDMRLRPFGESGPLAMSFEAMEAYYQAHGREWERYAWIKARVAAGDREAGQRLLKAMRPFVFRRYLDYGAYQAMRQMKQLIHQEVARKGLEHHIKLGRGGIREIEFIAQVFQLIRGGRSPELQDRRLLRILELLGQRHSLPDYVCRALAEAYTFLRYTEHRLQEFADQQTHEPPHDADTRLRLALAMGFPGWDEFHRALESHRRRVHGYFEQVFTAPQAVPDVIEGGAASALGAVWQGAVDRAHSLELLQHAGFEPAQETYTRLLQLRDGHSVRALSPEGRERLERLMPLLLGAVAHSTEPAANLHRVLTVIEAIARRTAYLSLLVENPLALSQLVKLCAASPWITRLLARHPILLDELLDPRRLYSPLDKQELSEDLDRALAAVPEDDLEQHMEVLRQFKQTQVLRVAAADVMGVLPLRRVSDYLTAVAEVLLRKVLDLSLAYLQERHGRPCYTENWREGDGSHCAGFAIIAYGKLGGIELGYGSDLDLVFLHDSAGEAQLTDGPKPIESSVFFYRLVQRIVHLLTAHTPAGVLYEVDMRLRPSGASGLLVSNVESFADYERNRAWTWEHQALVRARAIAGDEQVIRAFSAIRAEVLGRSRDPEQLRQEVCAMRERMRAAEGRPTPGWFDLKQGAGGIVDIEFMVQYGVLCWAAEHPELLDQTAALRFLEAFAATGLMRAEDAERLSDAYRVYRAEVHRLTLQEESARVPDDRLHGYRDAVKDLWRAIMRC